MISQSLCKIVHYVPLHVCEITCLENYIFANMNGNIMQKMSLQIQLSQTFMSTSWTKPLTSHVFQTKLVSGYIIHILSMLWVAVQNNNSRNIYYVSTTLLLFGLFLYFTYSFLKMSTKYNQDFSEVLFCTVWIYC